MNLPKFLFADDGDYTEDNPREFVIHNHWPRFIMEFVDGAGTPHFYDPEAEIIAGELKAGREPAKLIARLMREAGKTENQRKLMIAAGVGAATVRKLARPASMFSITSSARSPFQSAPRHPGGPCSVSAVAFFQHPKPASPRRKSSPS